jgi:hypothetical protein
MPLEIVKSGGLIEYLKKAKV